MYAPLISWGFFLILGLALPFWLTYFLRKNYPILHEDHFKNYSQGIGLYNLKLKSNPYAIYRPVIFLVRRAFLVLILYYGRDTTPALTIGLLLLSQMFAFIFNLHFKPLNTRSAHIFEMLDDSTVLLCIYFLYYFKGVEEPYNKSAGGWVIIIAMSLNIAIRIIIVLVEITREIIKLI